MAKNKVDKNMTFEEVMQKSPRSVEVMTRYGLHCIGCGIAALETIEQGSKVHGLSKKDTDNMIKEINQSII